MEPWIAVTLVAATAQTARFAVQRHLAATRLSTGGATLSRFLFAAPLLALSLALYARGTAPVLAGFDAAWLGFAATGALAQVLATLCTVTLFSLRAFAIGITLKNTAVLQAALLGAVLLGDPVGPGAAAAIGLGFLGVMVLGRRPGQGGGSLRAAALGLAAGALFAVSAVCYRGAILGLEGGDVAIRAGVTLLAVMAMQAGGLCAWLRLRQPGQIGAVLRAWRVAALAGLLSLVGSFGWFVAFALQPAAYVKALGQVELILSVAVSTLIFGERIGRREAAGIALVAASILLLVAAL